MKKVVGIGISGGVDSAAAAYLLKKDGYEVIGITMLLIDNEKSLKAIEDAKENAKIKIFFFQTAPRLSSPTKKTATPLQV